MLNMEWLEHTTLTSQDLLPRLWQELINEMQSQQNALTTLSQRVSALEAKPAAEKEADNNALSTD